MKDIFPEKPVIIGAGPAGLCAGWNLALNGSDVTILEKTDKIGGLALTFKEGDYLFDLGPHILHTFHEDILSFVKKILSNDLQQYHPSIKIFHSNKFVQYPLRGINVFTVLPMKMWVPTVISFMLARLKLFLLSAKEDDSFENWIKCRFGKRLYEVYFAPYAEKVWMIKASEISKYVAEQKVPELRVTDHIRSLFNRSPKYIHSEDPTRMEVYYPRKGIGQLTNWFYDKLVENNGKIERSVDILSIEGRNREVKSIIYRQNNELHRLETDMLISTMPINELIRSLKINVPQDVREAAEGFDYVSEVLFFLKVNRRKVLDASWVYFSSPEVRFNRVYDIGAFSKNCVPPGKTAYCIEFTCNKEDEIWNASAEDLYNHVIETFEKNNIMSRSDVDGYLVKKIGHAYPRFKVGFEKRIKRILDYLSSLENLVTLGRQGLFSYANVDDVLYMGFKACELLKSTSKEKLDYTQLIPESTRF